MYDRLTVFSVQTCLTINFTGDRNIFTKVSAPKGNRTNFQLSDFKHFYENSSEAGTLANENRKRKTLEFLKFSPGHS